MVSGNFKIDSAMQIMAQPSMMSPEGGQPDAFSRPWAWAHQGNAKTDRMPSPRQDLDEPDGLKLNIPPAFAGFSLVPYLRPI